MNNEYPRVAFFIPDLGIGGAEKVFTQLLNEFNLRNFKVDLLLSQDVGGFRKFVDKEVEITAFCNKRRSKPILLFNSFIGLLYFVLKYRPVAVYSTLTGANIVSLTVGLFVKSSNTKFIIREANVNDNNNWLYELLSRTLYKKANKVVAVSEGVKNDLINRLGVCSSKIVVIKNPVDIKKIKLMADAPLQEPLFNKKSNPVVVSIGRLCPQKDYETLIKSFKLVRLKSNAKLVIIGEGSEKRKLQQLVSLLGLDGSVLFLGVKNNPFAYLKSADVYVLSSKWEGFPNTLLEALAVKCPIVATDCHSGPAEILNGIKGCYLVPVGDKQKMGDAILKVLERPKERINPEKRLTEFTITNIAEEYLNLIT